MCAARSSEVMDGRLARLCQEEAAWSWRGRLPIGQERRLRPQWMEAPSFIAAQDGQQRYQFGVHPLLVCRLQ
jgi:hypothetical protein